MRILALTILILQSCLLKAQSLDSINFNFNNFTEKDTLVITQEIRDCGEFGGHTEYITIYKAKASVNAKLFREPPCKNDSPMDTTPTYRETIKLNPDQKELVVDYLRQFINMDTKNAVGSNAPSLFTVSVNKKLYLKEYPNSLPAFEWKDFFYLRDKLFLKLTDN